LVFMTPSRCIVERRINARSEHGLCARCGARATERKSSPQRTQGTQRNDLQAPCSLCTLWLKDLLPVRDSVESGLAPRGNGRETGTWGAASILKQHAHVPLSAILLIVAASACFTTVDVAVKHLSQRYPVPLIVWARWGIQALIVLALVGPRMRQRAQTISGTG